jgi:hypothetical protein
MGWFATAEALKHNFGAYGTVSESLRDEADPSRTLSVTLRQVAEEIRSGAFKPSHAAKVRYAYWARRAGQGVPWPWQMPETTQAGRSTESK